MPSARPATSRRARFSTPSARCVKPRRARSCRRPLRACEIAGLAPRLNAGVGGGYDADWPKAPRSDRAACRSGCRRFPTRGPSWTSSIGMRPRPRPAWRRNSMTSIASSRTFRSGGTYMSRDTQDFLADMRRMRVPAQSLSEVADIAPALPNGAPLSNPSSGTGSMPSSSSRLSWIRPTRISTATTSHPGQTRSQSENVPPQDQAVRPGTLRGGGGRHRQHLRASVS